MGGIGRLYLDTNVFIAMGEGPGAIANQLFDMVTCGKPGDGFLHTSELTLAELLVLPFRNKEDRLIDLYDGWIMTSDWLTVRPVDRGALWFAGKVRNQHPTVKLPDAIHLSTALGQGCTHFLTADKKLPSTLHLYNERWDLTKVFPPLITIR